MFVRALDDAILAGDIDCAVHSMKDIPAFRPSGLITAAVLKRDSAADYLAYNGSLDAVKVIGTSSTRRRAQLLRHDPEILIRDLRGNVDTRIRKMAAGEYRCYPVGRSRTDPDWHPYSGGALPPGKICSGT